MVIISNDIFSTVHSRTMQLIMKWKPDEFQFVKIGARHGDEISRASTYEKKLDERGQGEIGTLNAWQRVVSCIYIYIYIHIYIFCKIARRKRGNKIVWSNLAVSHSVLGFTWLHVRKSMSLLTRRAGNHCQENTEARLALRFWCGVCVPCRISRNLHC